MRLSEIDPATVNPGEKKDASHIAAAGEEELENYIRQHCSDILKDIQATGNLLYRGIKGSDLSVFVGKSRQDRQTKDTKQDVSAFFDKALASHGFKALRGNSIFVISDRKQAEQYGTIYAIFPMNGFNYMYTNQKDVIIRERLLVDYPENLIKDASDWYKKIINTMYREDPDNPRNGPNAPAFTTLEDTLEYVSQKLHNKNIPNYSAKLLDAKATICRVLYNMADTDNRNDPFLQKFKNFGSDTGSVPSQFWSMDAAIENLEPRNTDIQNPMREGKEICINGKYVAVLADAPFTDLLNKLAGL